MPVVRYIKGGRMAEPAPTPEPTLTALDVLSLEVAKRQLRVTDDSADEIVLDAISSAVYFVRDAGQVTLAEIAASPTLIQAAIVAMREFYNGYSEIPPAHAVWSLINVGACR